MWVNGQQQTQQRAVQLHLEAWTAIGELSAEEPDDNWCVLLLVYARQTVACPPFSKLSHTFFLEQNLLFLAYIFPLYQTFYNPLTPVSKFLTHKSQGSGYLLSPLPTIINLGTMELVDLCFFRSIAIITNKHTCAPFTSTGVCTRLLYSWQNMLRRQNIKFRIYYMMVVMVIWRCGNG